MREELFFKLVQNLGSASLGLPFMFFVACAVSPFDRLLVLEVSPLMAFSLLFCFVCLYGVPLTSALPSIV